MPIMNLFFTVLTPQIFFQFKEKTSKRSPHLFLVLYTCVYEQEQLCKPSIGVLRTYDLGNFSKPLFWLCFYVIRWCNFFAMFLFSFFGQTCKTTPVVSVSFNTCVANLLPCNGKQITAMPQIQKLSPHRQDSHTCKHKSGLSFSNFFQAAIASFVLTLPVSTS